MSGCCDASLSLRVHRERPPCASYRRAAALGTRACGACHMRGGGDRSLRCDVWIFSRAGDRARRAQSPAGAGPLYLRDRYEVTGGGCRRRCCVPAAQPCETVELGAQRGVDFASQMIIDLIVENAAACAVLLSDVHDAGVRPAMDVSSTTFRSGCAPQLMRAHRSSAAFNRGASTRARLTGVAPR